MGNTLSTTNTIEMNYRQTESNYNTNKALNESEMFMTMDRANSAIDDTLRQGFWTKYKIQEQEDPLVSKLAIHRGEGITSGNSAAREVRTFIGKESRDMVNVDSQVSTQVATIWNKAQNKVNSLYLQTYSQYKQAQANLFTEDEANSMVGGAFFGDALNFYSIFGKGSSDDKSISK